MSDSPATTTHRFHTALGDCVLRFSDTGISAVLMPGSPSARADAPTASPSETVLRAGEEITRLLSGERVDLRWIELDTTGVGAFSADVYTAAREISAGDTTSYGELARAAGHPGAAREVGVSLARNPFPIIVPCHRVLAADGALHGFSAPGGIATKRRMLEIEGAPGFEQQPLFA